MPRMIKDTNQEQAFVFVVDDDDSLREALGSLFRSVGLEVMTFASAPAFLSTKLHKVRLKSRGILRPGPIAPYCARQQKILPARARARRGQLARLFPMPRNL